MCLYIKKKSDKKEDFIKIAKRNMKVLKVLNFYCWGESIQLFTPYRGYTVNGEGDILIAKNFSFRQSYDYFKNKIVYDMIDKGIHSYTPSKLLFPDFTEVVMECIIPEGTPYVVGWHNEIVSLILVIPPLSNKQIEYIKAK